MNRTWALYKKEVRSYFVSPLFYVVAAVFLCLCGLFFYSDLNFFTQFGFGQDILNNFFQLLFVDMSRVMLVTLPLLTMRLFAEERKLGTLELLWTYPVRDAEIILGKFLACLAVVTVMVGATVVYPVMVAAFYPVAAGPLLAGYVGLWLLVAAFIACGLFLSALTDSQLVAGAATYGLLLFSWVITWNEAAVNEVTLHLLMPFSLFDRFYPFALGAIDTRDVTYLVLFTVAFLTFTFFALDSRRWRGLR